MRRIRIGTRGSPLALAQAHETEARLAAAAGWSAAEAAERLERVIVKTTGDRITDRPLAEAGGKGLFVKELEEALYDGRVDLAVFRPGNNTWYVLQSETNEVQSVPWGLAGDVPMTGDYDNNTNEPADFVVYRPADNVWYLLRSEGNVVDFVKFGAPGDIPVSSLAGLMQ